MATFEASIHPLAFAHMEGETKTVFVVPHTRQYSMVTSGDRIEFESIGSITIGAIRRYDSLDDLFKVEGWSNVVPEAETPELATAALRASDEWDLNSESTAGVIALRVRSTKRKS